MNAIKGRPHIDPTAIIHPDAKVGVGCIIGPHTVIGPTATIGDHCIIIGATVDGTLGAHCRVWRGAHVMTKTYVGKNTQLCANTSVLEGGRVGANSSIQIGTSIARTATVGEDVFIGPYVVFANHPRPRPDTPSSELCPIIVGDRVTIGTHVVLVGPLTIGEGCFIRAGAIVKRDMLPGETL